MNDQEIYSMVVQAIKESSMGNNPEALKVYEEFKKSKRVSVTLALCQSDDQVVAFIGLNILLENIKDLWHPSGRSRGSARDVAQLRDELSAAVFDLFARFSGFQVPKTLKMKYVSLLVEIVIRDWERNGPDYLKRICSDVAESSLEKIEIAVLFLSTLFEEVFKYSQTHGVGVYRRKLLKKGLGALTADILQFFVVPAITTMAGALSSNTASENRAYYDQVLRDALSSLVLCMQFSTTADVVRMNLIDVLLSLISNKMHLTVCVKALIQFAVLRLKEIRKWIHIDSNVINGNMSYRRNEKALASLDSDTYEQVAKLFVFSKNINEIGTVDTLDYTLIKDLTKFITLLGGGYYMTHLTSSEDLWVFSMVILDLADFRHSPLISSFSFHFWESIYSDTNYNFDKETSKQLISRIIPLYHRHLVELDIDLDVLANTAIYAREDFENDYAYTSFLKTYTDNVLKLVDLMTARDPESSHESMLSLYEIFINPQSTKKVRDVSLQLLKAFCAKISRLQKGTYSRFTGFQKGTVEPRALLERLFAYEDFSNAEVTMGVFDMINMLIVFLKDEDSVLRFIHRIVDILNMETPNNDIQDIRLKNSVCKNLANVGKKRGKILYRMYDDFISVFSEMYFTEIQRVDVLRFLIFLINNFDDLNTAEAAVNSLVGSIFEIGAQMISSIQSPVEMLLMLGVDGEKEDSATNRKNLLLYLSVLGAVIGDCRFWGNKKLVYRIPNSYFRAHKTYLYKFLGILHGVWQSNEIPSEYLEYFASPLNFDIFTELEPLQGEPPDQMLANIEASIMDGYLMNVEQNVTRTFRYYFYKITQEVYTIFEHLFRINIRSKEQISELETTLLSDIEQLPIQNLNWFLRKVIFKYLGAFSSNLFDPIIAFLRRSLEFYAAQHSYFKDDQGKNLSKEEIDIEIRDDRIISFYAQSIVTFIQRFEKKRLFFDNQDTLGNVIAILTNSLGFPDSKVRRGAINAIVSLLYEDQAANYIDYVFVDPVIQATISLLTSESDVTNFKRAIGLLTTLYTATGNKDVFMRSLQTATEKAKNKSNCQREMSYVSQDLRKARSESDIRLAFLKYAEKGLGIKTFDSNDRRFFSNDNDSRFMKNQKRFIRRGYSGDRGKEFRYSQARNIYHGIERKEAKQMAFEYREYKSRRRGRRGRRR